VTPLALNAALIACLGAGALDLTLLNLSVMPELYRVNPARPLRDAARIAERVPGPTKPATRLARSAPGLESAGAETPVRGDQPAALELVAVLEFESSSHHVDGAARFRLRQKLEALRDAPRIVIVGHADESGPEAFNDRLSHERAEAALRQLLARAIPAERIQLVARGEHQPLANGNSRRVEIYRGEEP
jgi:outer membrane protein OmpA-like peptidoglycan-associated protein